MKDPLKQGLKPAVGSEKCTYSPSVEVKDPLKQGLKPAYLGGRSSEKFGWSERSIKTRIETR